MKIGVIVAMDSEYQQVSSLLGGKSEGMLGNNYIVLRHCGIGKVNAALGVVELLKSESVDCIISTGVAGGIDAGLNVMDVVVGSEISYHDVWCGEGNEYGQVQGLPARFKGDERLLASVMKLNELQNETKIKAGLICSGDQFITNKEALAKIKQHFPDGLAVEMESGAMAHTCYKYNIPFLSCRIISDTPGNTEDHAAQYADFWKEMSNRSFKIIKQLLEIL